MLLKNKYVMISGVGPGLGVKLALHAAIEGAAGVALSARTASKLDDAEARILASGSTCKIVKHITDICDAHQCRAFTEATLTQFGRIDVPAPSCHNNWRSIINLNQLFEG